MFDDYDGIVKIKTGLDIGTIKEDAEALKKSLDASTGNIRTLCDTVKAYTQTFSAALRTANNDLSTQLQLVTRLKEAFAGVPFLQTSQGKGGGGGVVGGQTESAEYAALRKRAEEISRQLDAAAAKLNKLIATTEGGVSALSGTKRYVSLQYDVETLREQYEALLEQMQAIEDAGQRFVTVPEQTKQRQGDISKLALEYMKLAENAQKAAIAENQNADALNQKYADIVNQLPDMFREIMQDVTDGLRDGIGGEDDSIEDEIEDVVDEIEDAHEKVREESDKTNKKMRQNSDMNLANIVKYAVGLRSLYVIWGKARSAARESIGVMAQYDPQLNRTISNLLTAMKQLRADVGTIIQPIVSTLAPVLTVILEKVHKIAHGVAQFVAALVGQDYIEVATVQAYDYAKSLDAAAESAKALGAYDKLNIINKNDTANTLALTKDTVKYTKEALDNNSWTVKLGTRLHEIFTTAKEAVEDIYERLTQAKWFQKMKEKLKEILNDPDKLLVAIGILGVGKALGNMLLRGVAGSGFSSGILGLIPKIATIALVAVVAYKLGNKIFDSLPEGLKDELADEVGGYVEAFEENGLKGAIEHFGDEVVFTFTETYSEMSNAADDFVEAVMEGKLFPEDDTIPYRMPRPKVTPPTEEEKRLMELQSKMYYAQLHLKNQKDLQEFAAKMKPLIAEFNVKFKEKWGVTPKEAFENIKAQLLLAWVNPNNPIRNGIATIGDAFKTWWGNIWKTPDEKAREALANGISNVGTNLSLMWNMPTNGVKTSLTAISTGFKSLFGNAFKVDKDPDTTWTGTRFKNMGDRLKGAWDAKDNPIKTALDKIKSGFKSIWDSLFNTNNDTFPKFTLTNDQKTNAETQGKTLAEKVRDGFKSIFSNDQDISQTVTEKISNAMVSGFNLASQVSALFNKGIANVTNAKNLATSTTKQGDIVLKLDGKVVAKSVWDNTAKVYKQTGVSMI